MSSGEKNLPQESGEPKESEKATTYTLKEKEITREDLNKLGIKVYVVEGWELLTLILGNLEYFQDEEHGIWLPICPGGIARSANANRTLREIGVPTASQPAKLSFNQGLRFVTLLAMIAEGKINEKKLRMNGLNKAVNKLGIFFSEDLFSSDDVLDLVNAAFETRAFDQESMEEITIFLISDNEDTFSAATRIIFDAVTQRKKPSEMLAKFEESYNSGKRRLDYSNPQELF